jgi:membrane fusion protein, multidrug efflux system
VATVLGARVAPGDELARLAMGDRVARLRRAEARLADARREHDSARQLVERGVAPEVRLQIAEAELEVARAEVESIEVEIDNTVLRAPIAGVVNALLAEVGDFLPVVGEAVEIVDNNPLVAVVRVPQHAVARVRPGSEARVSPVGGEPVEGRVRFVAALADAATRTFRVDIKVPNPDGELPSGVSAEVVIPTEEVLAHRISPALAALNDRGEIGVFAVDEDETVVFHRVQLVRADAEGVWVTGPPERVRLIIARPGFLSDGQRVEAREVAEAPEAAGS